MDDRCQNAAPCFLVGLLYLSLTTCSTLPKRTFKPEVDPATLDDTLFVHYIASLPTVTVAEGIRGVLLLAETTEPLPTDGLRRDELIRLGAFKSSWDLADDDALDIGTLGYMLRVMCDLSPSLSERVASLTGLGERRYALRRCIDAGLLPYSAAARPVRGGELVAALAAAEKFRAPPLPSPPVKLGTETP